MKTDVEPSFLVLVYHNVLYPTSSVHLSLVKLISGPTELLSVPFTSTVTSPYLRFFCVPLKTVNSSMAKTPKSEKKEKKEKKEKRDDRNSSSPEKETAPTEHQVVPIAKPLADSSLCKKVLKLAKSAAKKKQIKRGVKEVVKALRKNVAGVCVLAGKDYFRATYSSTRCVRFMTYPPNTLHFGRVARSLVGAVGAHFQRAQLCRKPNDVN